MSGEPWRPLPLGGLHRRAGTAGWRAFEPAADAPLLPPAEPPNCMSPNRSALRASAETGAIEAREDDVLQPRPSRSRASSVRPSQSQRAARRRAAAQAEPDLSEETTVASDAWVRAPVPGARVAGPEEDRQRLAARLYRGGLSLAEVGERVGCSLPVARRLVAAAGVEIRGPGRGPGRGAGRKRGGARMERIPGLTWLPADDPFMSQERRLMLTYLVEERGLDWSACLRALEVDAEILAADVAALGLGLEPGQDEAAAAPDPSTRAVSGAKSSATPRGRRLKDAEHLLEDLATMRSMQDQGVPLAEIAAIFGLSVPTLKRRLTMTEDEVRTHVGV